MRFALILLACAAVGGCQSNGDIAYAPTVPVAAGPPASVSGVTTQDDRGEKPNRLATVRGLYGNPAQVFDTNRPVADEVSDAFAAALRARGMLAAAAPFRIVLTLRKYYGETYVARRAFVDLDLAVIDRSGQTVYRDSYKNDIGGFDLFSDIKDLVPFTEKMMNLAIDALLDKPGFRAALAARGRPGPVPAA